MKTLKSGRYGIRLRFFGESLVERYFDSRFFGGWDHKAKHLVIDRSINYQGYLQPLTSDTTAHLARLHGKSVVVELSTWNRRGEKFAGTINGVIGGAWQERNEEANAPTTVWTFTVDAMSK